MAEAILFCQRGLLRFSASVGFEGIRVLPAQPAFLCFAELRSWLAFTPLSFTPTAEQLSLVSIAQAGRNECQACIHRFQKPFTAGSSELLV